MNLLCLTDQYDHSIQGDIHIRKVHRNQFSRPVCSHQYY